MRWVELVLFGKKPVMWMRKAITIAWIKTNSLASLRAFISLKISHLSSIVLEMTNVLHFHALREATIELKSNIYRCIIRFWHFWMESSFVYNTMDKQTNKHTKIEFDLRKRISDILVCYKYISYNPFNLLYLYILALSLPFKIGNYSIWFIFRCTHSLRTLRKNKSSETKILFESQYSLCCNF